MLDRIPSPGKAGRMLITPEDGSPAFYATVTMADEPIQDGSPFSKATMLSDPTAAMFGLDAEAVPNDVFSWLGHYNEHWWRKVYSTGAVEYVHSSDRNAYPDSGEVDGVVYEYLGVPFSKFPAVPQVSTGSYVGTGQYGKDYYTELQVGFDPKFVYIAAEENALFHEGSNYPCNQFFMWVEGMTKAEMFDFNGTTYLYPEVVDGVFRFRQYATVSNTHPDPTQGGINQSGLTYHWIALGFSK